jgi:hypothetical protein
VIARRELALAGSSFVAGPYLSGTIIKLVQFRVERRTAQVARARPPRFSSFREDGISRLG